MAWLLVLASVGIVVGAGDQAAKYVSNQGKKQLFLVGMKEDVAILNSCLQPQYRHGKVKPEFIVPAGDISKIVPSSSSGEKKYR